MTTLDKRKIKNIVTRAIAKRMKSDPDTMLRMYEDSEDLSATYNKIFELFDNLQRKPEWDAFIKEDRTFADMLKRFDSELLTGRMTMREFTEYLLKRADSKYVNR